MQQISKAVKIIIFYLADSAIFYFYFLQKHRYLL